MGETTSWYKVTLSSTDVAEGRQVQMEDACYALFVKAEAPKEAGVGMFSLKDETRYVFYFSPAAAEIAMPVIDHYGGVPCPPPKSSEVGILWSHSADLETFPFAAAA